MGNAGGLPRCSRSWTRATPGELPAIACHVGALSPGRETLEYNLTPATMQAIAKRKDVIGPILSEHLTGDSSDETGRARSQAPVG